MKPVCVKCQRFYRPAKNGVGLLETTPRFNGAQPGAAHAEDWTPYKIWVADLWRCPGCGHEMIQGFGGGPIAEHFMANFDAVTAGRKTYTVNDC